MSKAKDWMPALTPIRVVILNSRTACAGCGAWFKTEVRRMSEDYNEFRNQPQCPTCRSKVARGARKPEPAQPCAPAPDLSMCKSADCPVHREKAK